MRTTQQLGGVAYVRVEAQPISEAVRRGLGDCLATISAEGLCELPRAFFAHDLPFQFAWWGDMFFGKGAEAATRRLPSVTINVFRNAGLVGQDGVVFLADGTELDYHLAFTQPFRPDSLVRQIEGTLWRPHLPATFCPGCYLLGHTPAWSNYAHWLTDSMPIWMYYAMHLKHQGIKLVVPPLSSVQSEALALLGIGESDLMRTDGGVKQFEELLVPSMISVWEPPALFRNAALHIVTKVASTGRPSLTHKRLYFSRRDVSRRRLLNESVVEQLLSELNFQLVCCSELSFADQVASAATADIIIGCHGAAMANLIFCKAGCSVIELFPEYCAQPEFRAIAARCECPYGYIIGTSFDRENSRRDQNSWDADFVIDIEALKRALALAGVAH